jgi:anti-anti-sigma factor
MVAIIPIVGRRPDRDQFTSKVWLKEIVSHCSLMNVEIKFTSCYKRNLMSHMQLIRISQNANSPLVSFTSEHLNRLDTAREIGLQLIELIDNCRTLAGDQDCLNLDFSHIDRISSAGLNELIGINSQARSHGVRMVLVNVPKPIREIFAMTRLERLFEFSTTSAPV